ncbi:MAG: FkbM family methyltransferase [Pseudomonadota bacterium]
MYPPPRFLLENPLMERWVSTLYRDWARLFRPRWGVERRFGRDLLIDQTCPVGRNMLSRGMAEFRQIERFEAEIRARATSRPAIFLDVGAFWGLYALYFEQTGLFDQIHCFEPSPRNRAHLRCHLTMNGLSDRIQTHAIAASDQTGTAWFQEGGGGSQIAEDGSVEVPLRPLDTLFDFRDMFLAIKLDTEGHERQALTGMRRLLAQNTILLQVEIWEENRSDMLPFLGELGLTQIGAYRDEFWFVGDP